MSTLEQRYSTKEFILVGHSRRFEKQYFKSLYGPILKSVAVFDLDGTLSDDRHRQCLMPKRIKQNPSEYAEGAWDIYDRASADDPVNPRILDELESWRAAGRLIVILTGRRHSNWLSKQTLGWLNDKGVSYDAVVMRASNNVASNSNYKVDWVVKNHWLDVAHIYDDNPEVIEKLGRMGIYGTLIE